MSGNKYKIGDMVYSIEVKLVPIKKPTPTCTVCDGTSRVTIKDQVYRCPACMHRPKHNIKTRQEYFVSETPYIIESITECQKSTAVLCKAEEYSVKITDILKPCYDYGLVTCLGDRLFHMFAYENAIFKDKENAQARCDELNAACNNRREAT